MIEQTRRGLITGLISLVAAPAIVRAAILMPVKAVNLSTVDVVNLAHQQTGYMTLDDYAERILLPRLRALRAARSEWYDLWAETARLVTTTVPKPEDVPPLHE